jgi:hypothetical protein
MSTIMWLLKAIAAACLVVATVVIGLVLFLKYAALEHSVVENYQANLPAGLEYTLQVHETLQLPLDEIMYRGVAEDGMPVIRLAPRTWFPMDVPVPVTRTALSRDVIGSLKLWSGEIWIIDFSPDHITILVPESVMEEDANQAERPKRSANSFLQC